MTRLATILLLAATINAQFAGDAAAGSILPRPRSCPRRLWRPRRRRWTRSDEGRTNFLPLARAQESFPPLEMSLDQRLTN